MIAQDPTLKPTAQYDTFGRSLDSLAARNRDIDYVTGDRFQAYTEINAVGNYNIANINAGKITAGTIDASVIDVINLDAGNITSGTIVASLGVGTTSGGFVMIDGANNNIVVNDGTTNRVLIGYQASGF